MLPAGAAELVQAETVLVAAARQTNGNFVAALLSETGTQLGNVDLPGRGHDITHSAASGHYVVFARRPGVFAIVFDQAGNNLHTLHSTPGRHFYGHGQFSADSRLLFATENDFENGVGKIGIYDATRNYQRIAEWPSGGVGPHDLVVTEDGTHLCVANGGIETHPDFGRQKLNLPTMQPNISWIEISSGHIMARHELPAELHQLSTRHLSLGRDGTIWFATQNQAQTNQPAQLVGRVGLNQELSWLHLPDAALNSLRGYVGSIATSNDRARIALTSSVGGSLIVASEFGEVLSQTNIEAASGVAASAGGFAHTTLNGNFGSEPELAFQTDLAFDNHLYASAI